MAKSREKRKTQKTNYVKKTRNIRSGQKERCKEAGKKTHYATK